MLFFCFFSSHDVCPKANAPIVSTLFGILILDMVKQLVKSMTTDLTSKEITTYLADVIAMSGDNVKEYVLPADGQYSVETVDGVTVYRFDADVVRKDVADFMYNPVMQQDIVDTNDTEK